MPKDDEPNALGQRAYERNGEVYVTSPKAPQTPHSRLTPEVEKEILRVIRNGCPQNHAAAAAGIWDRTLRQWLYKGARGEEPYASFTARFKQAQAQYIASGFKTINDAGSTDWKATAWILPRLDPSLSERVQLQVQQQVDTMLNKLRVGLTQADYEKVLAVLADDTIDGSELDEEELVGTAEATRALAAR